MGKGGLSSVLLLRRFGEGPKWELTPMVCRMCNITPWRITSLQQGQWLLYLPLQSTVTSIDHERYRTAPEKWLVVVVGFVPSGYFLGG